MKNLFLAAFLSLFALSSFGLNANTSNQQQTCNGCSSNSKKNNKKSITAKKHKKHSAELSLSCSCSSKCELGCLRSKTCNLSFTLLAAAPGTQGLVGTFQVSIIAPNGETVATANIDASTISTDNEFNPSSFVLQVPAPVCAGHYTVLINNVSVDLDDSFGFVPFFQVNVQNSCNTNQINQPVPVNFLPDFFGGGFDPGILQPGTSTEIDVNIYPSFLPNFKKCKTECSCEK